MPGELPPSGTPAPDVTTLLVDWRRGDRRAYDALFPLVYEDLRLRARRALRAESADNELSTTALVHEAYLKLVGSEDPGWRSRAHFFGAAAQAMRDILVDQARRKSRVKRGGDRRRVPMDDVQIAEARFESPAEELLALDAALARLGERHPRTAEVVQFRYFAGLGNETIAELLGLSTRTVEREWRFAKAWLARELSDVAS